MFKSAYKDLKHVALGVSPLEAKVLEQTSNEPWGPHGTVLGELASYTRDSQDTTIIFTILRRRMMDEGKDWRHVYKSLSVGVHIQQHNPGREQVSCMCTLIQIPFPGIRLRYVHNRKILLLVETLNAAYPMCC